MNHVNLEKRILMERELAHLTINNSMLKLY
jgi:hypothetical protein